MNCKTLISLYIPAGADMLKTSVRCGYIDPRDQYQVLCPSCRTLRGRDILAREREIATDNKEKKI
tara:strand:+ start:465 stop:659 length:195 start_codon:yes stop_codon:yes gene_type:complete